jgi:hypothetical protein
MQTGCLRSARATVPSKRHCFGSIAVLALGLAASACVSGGQLANLTATARPTIAIESIEAPPSTDVPRFVTMLKDEAAQRRIAADAPSEANYRLHGYLAARTDNTAAPAARATAPSETTSIAWMLDVYDCDQHRLVRLSGEETIAGRASASTEDQALRRIARAGMDQLAAFLATSRAPSTAAAVAAAPPRTAAGWLDDWTPEASGIFRIFGREPSPPAAEARVPAPADDIPLPRGRPAAPPSTAVAIATADPAENAR